MGKRILEMKLIENEKVRKKALGKRKKNLLKKAEELSVLCDSKTLVIIFDQDKQKPEIWTDNDEEAGQIINRFKHKSVKGRGEKAFGSSASQKKRLGEKFPIPNDHKTMINHLSQNQLQNLCCELDAKIAAVMNVFEAKQQDLTERQEMLGDEGKGLLNKGKAKEVLVHEEPVSIQQDQSFQMLYPNPNCMENPMTTTIQNGTFSYPHQFDDSSSSSNIPFVSLPIHCHDSSRMQPAYMNSNSFMSYNDPTLCHISPGSPYPMMMPGFPALR